MTGKFEHIVSYIIVNFNAVSRPSKYIFTFTFNKILILKALINSKHTVNSSHHLWTSIKPARPAV